MSMLMDSYGRKLLFDSHEILSKSKRISSSSASYLQHILWSFSMEVKEILVSFVLEEVLNQDAKAKTITILGKCGQEHAIIIAEKTAFTADDIDLICKPDDVRTDVVNDVYHKCFVALANNVDSKPAAKYSLIYPATETHIAKYRHQSMRMISETPHLYTNVVLPYIKTMIGSRIDWVHNILNHEAESDRILYEDTDPVNGFILLPDLKWDGVTMSSLYFVCMVHRWDIHSLRDLNGSHIAFLQHLKTSCITAVCSKYNLQKDQLRLYVHYQPSYYHFHIHVQTCDYEAGAGQAIGKAWLLEDIIESLRRDSMSFAERTLYYSLGEKSELYSLIHDFSS